jgi:hypothetical protein
MLELDAAADQLYWVIGSPYGGSVQRINSGVYFAKLRAGRLVKTHKMVLTR